MPNPNPKLLPPVDYLRECFDYNPDSGVIQWRTRPREHFSSDVAYSNHYFNFAGREITHVDPHGYLNLTLDYVHYRAARVIWKMITEEEPPRIVDHADLNKLNNKWSNLRAATPSQSLRNRTRKPKATGPRGVTPSGKKWRASIHGRYIGTFITAEEASTAYEKAACELHGEFYYNRES